jgi:hypothetical protein
MSVHPKRTLNHWISCPQVDQSHFHLPGNCLDQKIGNCGEKLLTKLWWLLGITRKPSLIHQWLAANLHYYHITGAIQGLLSCYCMAKIRYFRATGMMACIINMTPSPWSWPSSRTFLCMQIRTTPVFLYSRYKSLPKLPDMVRFKTIRLWWLFLQSDDGRGSDQCRPAGADTTVHCRDFNSGEFVIACNRLISLEVARDEIAAVDPSL